MYNLLFFFISPSSNAEVAILIHFPFLFILPSYYGKAIILVYVIFLQGRFCYSCYLLFCKEKNVFCLLHIPSIKNLLFSFLFPSFRFLPYRSCHSSLFHLLCIQKLLFLLISPSSNAEVVIFIHFVFPAYRSFYSSFFHIFLKQKLLSAPISPSSHTKAIVLVHFTIVSRNCSFRSVHIPHAEVVIPIYFILLQ